MKALVAALVVGVICGWVVYSRADLSRTGTRLDAAEDSLRQVEAELAAESAKPDLPDGQVNWLNLRLLTSACGLTFAPDQADAAGSSGEPVFYQGPAQAWHARIQGPALAVVACASELIEKYPVIAGTISVASDGPAATAVMTLSLLGTF